MTDKSITKSNSPLNSRDAFSPVTCIISMLFCVHIYCFDFVVSKSPAAASPQRNLTGLPRVARDIAADVYNNIQKWNDYHIKGANVIKEIGQLLSEDPRNLSPALETNTNKLHDIVQNLKIFSDALEFLATQMTALVKLRKDNVPLFISLPADALADIVHHIAEAYKAEFKVNSVIFYQLQNFQLSLSVFSARSMFLKTLHFPRIKMKSCFMQVAGHIKKMY